MNAYVNSKIYSRLEKVGSTLDEMYKKNLNYIVLPGKKKNGIFMMKVGFFKFSVRTQPHLCCDMCNIDAYNDDMCSHMLYLLSFHLKLSDFVIGHLCIPEIYDEFSKMLTETIKNTDLEEKIMNYFKGKICGICHTDLSNKKGGFNLFYCNKCRNFVHSKCMDAWMNKKIKSAPNIEKGCIYCKNKDF